MKATPIPQASRRALSQRDHDRCVRCAGRGTQWHHRRSRSVRDDHTHHPGNGVLLCLSCHDWVHDNPTAAMKVGLIVSRHTEDPCGVSFTGYYGTVFAGCHSTQLQFQPVERRSPT